MLNILVGGSKDGKGWFFPDGVNGRINSTEPLALPVRWTGQRWRPAHLLAGGLS